MIRGIRATGHGFGYRPDVKPSAAVRWLKRYTDATRLFGKDFLTKSASPKPEGGPGPDPPPPPEPVVSVEGFSVHVSDAGRYVAAQVDGQARPTPLEEYKARLAAKLVAEVASLPDFRGRWVDPAARQELLDRLVAAGYSPTLVRMVDDKNDYDLFDVLGELGWDMRPRTRRDRSLAFAHKHEDLADERADHPWGLHVDSEMAGTLDNALNRAIQSFMPSGLCTFV